MVIFGAGGDLTKRLVMPALYNLARTKLLPENFALIGVDRARGNRRELARPSARHARKLMSATWRPSSMSTQIDEAAWKRLAEKMSYVQGDLTKPELYEKLAAPWTRRRRRTARRATSSSISPSPTGFFGTVVEQLGKAKLTGQNEDEDGKPGSGAAW